MSQYMFSRPVSMDGKLRLVVFVSGPEVIRLFPCSTHPSMKF